MSDQNTQNSRMNDCRNPFVKAANRQYKLMTGGDTLCGSATKAVRPADPPSRHKTLFLNPFLKAADAKHHLHTGYHLIAGQAAGLRSAASSLRKHQPLVLRRARRRQLNRWLAIQNPRLKNVLPWGALSVSLYALLFINADAVLAASTGNWWSPLVPVVIALVFSVAHGNFTGAFWDAIGLKPNTIRK